MRKEKLVQAYINLRLKIKKVFKISTKQGANNLIDEHFWEKWIVGFQFALCFVKSKRKTRKLI